MRHVLLGLAGAAALGLGALTVAPAQAQGISVTIGSGYGGYGYGGYHRPAYGYYPARRPVYYRPAPVYRAYPRYARPVYYAPRCTIRTSRSWDGYGWVIRKREVCR